MGIYSVLTYSFKREQVTNLVVLVFYTRRDVLAKLKNLF